MCGIAGALFRHGPPAGLSAQGVVEAMSAALRHRGPDGLGLWTSPTEAGPSAMTVVLAHRRLAVIDLTDRAAQPMSSPRVPVTVTFNGEIYNFRELQTVLRRCGRTFQSDSDTEVLLQGYEEWGPDVVERLRGMFAFAIADARTGLLLLGRDRLGIKPLYTYEAGEMLLFASEIEALLASGLVPRRLDLTALDDYLAYQTVPAPRTLVRDVRAMLPGHVGTAGRAQVLSVRAYWDVLDRGDPDARAIRRVEEARERVGTLLAESAALHMVSDVPVGIFLSGGIDSSALVALVQRAGFTPRTFTITCPGTSFDEAPYAKEVADRFGAIHTELPLTGDELFRQLPDALAAMDHPSGDGVNSFVVSRAVRGAGMKVALSGLGGDEFFGGYPSFARAARLARWARGWRHAPRGLRRAAGEAVSVLGGRSVGSGKVAAILESDGSLAEAFPIMRQMFSRDQRAALLERSPGSPGEEVAGYGALIRDAIRRHPAADSMALVSFAEARTYMHDVLLRDTDQMSMRHSLEVRVPLLDHRLVECLMGLAEGVKQASSGPKSLLLESLGVAVPDIVSRPKQGFVLPFETWMRGALRPLCEAALGAGGPLGGCLFRQAGVQALWSAFLARDRRVTWSRPWTLVALSSWLDRTGVRP